MKRVIFALGILLAFACSKTTENSATIIPSNPTLTTLTPAPKFIINNFTITNFSIPNITGAQIQIGVNGSISGTILYSKDNILNLVIPATLFFTTPLIPAIHLIKSNNNWQYENSYDDGAMGCARNYECIDSLNQSWVYADHGFELSSGTWPFGNMMLMRTTGNKLSFTNISNDRSFYHSISTGDLNNDGTKDVVGLNMGTKGNWYDNLHPYLQKSDGTFEATRTLVSYNN